MDKIKLIYLMGAGRSGTTALATFLGASEEIQVVGEMHQFFEHLMKDIPCSCGDKLTDCCFWKKVVDQLPATVVTEICEIEKLTSTVEAHTNIIHHLIKKEAFSNSEIYLPLMENIFNALMKANNKVVLLDSAKYISRALALRNLTSVDLKVIYMVRDVRGVAHSFSKNVQSSRGTLSAILYYLTVNVAAELACFFGLKGKVLKVRYEDMMSQPVVFFNKLEEFLGIDLQHLRNKIEFDEGFEIGHLIGGNRIKDSHAIKFKADVRWNKILSKPKQVFMYIGAFPLMLINRYPIFNKD